MELTEDPKEQNNYPRVGTHKPCLFCQSLSLDMSINVGEYYFQVLTLVLLHLFNSMKVCYCVCL